jgi:hypothetical protein
VTVTFVHPVAGQNCGPGFSWQANWTPIAPPNSHVRGELFSDTGGDTGVGLQTNGISGVSGAGVVGIVYPGTTPLITTPRPGVQTGQTGTLHIDVIAPPNTVIDSGNVAVVLDFVTGLPYLTSVWPVATGAGHDPMLDTILAAVSKSYVNAP